MLNYSLTDVSGGVVYATAIARSLADAIREFFPHPSATVLVMQDGHALIDLDGDVYKVVDTTH